MRMTVTTPRCQVCKQTGQIEVDAAAFILWRDGAYVQDAFPDLDADQRELLMTGTHAHCWATIFGGDDDE